MRTQRVAGLGLALLLAGCGTAPIVSATKGTGSPTPKQAGAGLIDSEAGPPPLLLKNPSPAALSLLVSLNVGGYVPATRNTTEISISFTRAGRRVQFVGNERVTCNGVSVPRNGSGFFVTLPTTTFAGKLVTCTFVSGTSTAGLTFTAPPAPAILSPADNARLVRSKRTAVSFRVGGRSTDFYVIAIGPDRKAWTYPAAGVSQVNLDTSAFSTGPGSIALRQSFTLPDLHAPAFHSASSQGDMAQQISVTWV